MPGEIGGAGESKAADSTRIATVDPSVFEKSSCTLQIPPACASVTTSVTDVHRRNATRVTDFHGDNDDDDGDFDRTEGDLRVTTSEAADCACDASVSAQLETQCHVPLSKDDYDDLTKFAIGGATMHQPQLRAPRPRDGSPGGDAGGVENDTNNRNSLVDERQTLASVGRVSNDGQPELGTSTSGHHNPVCVVPLLGEPAGGPVLNHPIVASTQPREALSSIPPRATGPLRILPSGSMLSSEPDIWDKPCMSQAGIPLGIAAEDLSEENLSPSETSGRAPVATFVATATDETSLSAGQSRLLVQETAGETAGIPVFPQNGPRPSESRGTAWANSPPIKAEPAEESAKSRPMDDQSPNALGRLPSRQDGAEFLCRPGRKELTLVQEEGKSHPVEFVPALALTDPAVYPVGGAVVTPKTNVG
jgi:hypothetical protein